MNKVAVMQRWEGLMWRGIRETLIRAGGGAREREGERLSAGSLSAGGESRLCGKGSMRSAAALRPVWSRHAV